MQQFFRVIGWNVNGLRARYDHIERLFKELKPDVVCMQETKIANDLFPTSFFANSGYKHVHFHGQKSHHGVAIVSKLPLQNPQTFVYAQKDDCRHTSAIVELRGQPIQIHNFYVPSGGDEPDTALNDKFDHKLRYWEDMAVKLPMSLEKNALLIGDLNVAPRESDVWDHKRMQKMVGHSPMEVEALDKAMLAGGWTDLVRRFTPVEQPLYSWWTYRSKTALERDRGWRLDHAWGTDSLCSIVKNCQIFRDARAWDKPSDHAPVIVDINL